MGEECTSISFYDGSPGPRFFACRGNRFWCTGCMGLFEGVELSHHDDGENLYCDRCVSESFLVDGGEFRFPCSECQSSGCLLADRFYVSQMVQCGTRVIHTLFGNKEVPSMYCKSCQAMGNPFY